MKKFLIATIATITLMSSTALAAGVNVDGKTLEQEAIILEGRTLVPVRGVFEELGYEVSYDQTTKTATLSKDDVIVSMTSGDTFFTVNDKTFTPEIPQQIIDGRFMLPLRAVGEAIGVDVNWDPDTKTALIISSSIIIEPQVPGDGVNIIVF